MISDAMFASGFRNSNMEGGHGTAKKREADIVTFFEEVDRELRLFGLAGKWGNAVRGEQKLAIDRLEVFKKLKT